MAIFASTTLSNYSDPYRALTLKALEKRQADMAARAASAEIPKAETPMAVAGVGLGAIGDALQQRSANQALVARKNELAGIMAGIDPVKGPSPQQAAALYGIDPDLGGKMLQNQYDMGRDERKFAHEDATLGKTQDFTRGENTLNRQQQADLAAKQQVHAKELADQSNQLQRDLATQAQNARADLAQAQREHEAVQGEYNRANDVGKLQLKATLDAKAAALQQAHEKVLQTQSETAKAALPQSDQGKIMSDQQKGLLTSDQAAAALKPEIKPAVEKLKTDAMTDYRQHTSSLARLERAQAILDKGPGSIYTGWQQNVAPGVSGLPGGGYIVDKQKAQDTAEFNSIVNKEAIEAMSRTLKGASTDKEMNEFLRLLNNPNVSDEARQAGLRNLIIAARADRNIKADEVRRVGGDVSSVDADMKQSGPAASATPAAAAAAAGGDIAAAKAWLADPANANHPLRSQVEQKVGGR